MSPQSEYLLICNISFEIKNNVVQIPFKFPTVIVLFCSSPRCVLSAHLYVSRLYHKNIVLYVRYLYPQVLLLFVERYVIIQD